MLLSASTAEAANLLPVWTLIPFVLMLLFVAVAPLVIEHWWEQNKNKLIISLALGIPTAVYLLIIGQGAALEHQLLGDYLPFIVLLTALFVITGGIHLSGDIKAKPIVNTLFLAIGYVLASFMGTTGAAMLLIRPVISTNSQRQYKVHTILFFIAAVANCGGLLTPLGDPPLLLLYLRGAPFTWFFHLFPEWLFTGAYLLLAYFIIDSYFYKKEPWHHLSADAREITPLRIGGLINLIYLAGVIAAVAFINEDFIPAIKEPHAPFYLTYLREIILVAMIFLSWFTTKKKLRELNHYSWAPIVEVGILFLGIFTTMTPALEFLREHAPNLGLHAPWQFYYTTGLLSSFLDNAPTAVAFYEVAQGLGTAGYEGQALVAGIPEMLLKSIAIGSVFFGSMTYIGNGPNFMVKAIAEENGIKMPSFFGYMFKFSLLMLLPIYFFVHVLFLN